MYIKIAVSLRGPLNRYFQGKMSGEMLLPEGAAVADVLQQLSLSREKTSLIVVNGEKALMATLLKEGDQITLFPPVSGG